MATSSLAEKQSCSSTTRTSAMRAPACASASAAARAPMPWPTSSTADPAEEARAVGGERLAGDEDGLRAQVGARVEEARETRTAAAPPSDVGQHCSLVSGPVDGLGGEDLLERVDVLELGVGVVDRVGVVDARDLGHVLGAGRRALMGGQRMLLQARRDSLLHVLQPRVPKQLRRARRARQAPRLGHDHGARQDGVRPVLEEALQRAGEHLLEADDEHAVGLAVADHVAAHVQARRARRAVVVDVVDGDACHAELVEDALAASRVAVAVARHTLLDVVVVDLRVQQRLDARLEAELRVVDLAARLDEFGHADAEDVDRVGGAGGGHVVRLRWEEVAISGCDWRVGCGRLRV